MPWAVGVRRLYVSVRDIINSSVSYSDNKEKNWPFACHSVLPFMYYANTLSERDHVCNGKQYISGVRKLVSGLIMCAAYPK